MKKKIEKIVALLLVTVMCLSFVACSKVDIKEAVLGDWKGEVYVDTRSPEERENPDSIEEGYYIKYTYSFYKGGTFNLITFNPEVGYPIDQSNGTWEIVDGVIVVTGTDCVKGGVYSYSLTIDTESNPYTLTALTSGLVYTKVM